jgi:hypothetical protein
MDKVSQLTTLMVFIHGVEIRLYQTCCVSVCRDSDIMACVCAEVSVVGSSLEDGELDGEREAAKSTT